METRFFTNLFLLFFAYNGVLANEECSNVPEPLIRLAHGVDITTLTLLPWNGLRPDGFRGKVFEYKCVKNVTWKDPNTNEVFRIPDQVMSFYSTPGSWQKIVSKVRYDKGVLWHVHILGNTNDKQPRFSPFANLCKSAGFFLQGSTKIVALNFEDSYRSAGSLQKYADFLQRFLQKYDFLQLLRNQYTAFLDLFNYFKLYQLFYLIKAQSVDTPDHSKISRMKICPHHGNFGDWRMRRIGYTPSFIHFT